MSGRRQGGPFRSVCCRLTLLETPQRARRERAFVHRVAGHPKLERAKGGAPGRDRTRDLRFTKPLLYQLSYKGTALR
ncbi:hypothetical protein MPLB_1080120 [Mesorhizobium sp. ORS 3324]|nr:hypothetical protein MPLB_1080120 [Mesorhizobium sp. ORS 3324]